MTLHTYFIAFAVFPLLLARGCANESEENNNEDPEFAIVHYAKDETVTREMAIENWEMFLKQSQESIDNAETNLGQLETRLEQADASQKADWQQVSGLSSFELIRLKAKRMRRNKEFNNELKAYNRDVYERNEAFEADFNAEMSVINTRITGIYEKIRSGYYK